MTDIQFTPQEFVNFFRYFKGEPQQIDGVELLRQAIAQSDPALLTAAAHWVMKYREESPAPPTSANPLPVPYFSQNDNGPEGWRQCQTSSIAMCLKFLQVPGINDDTDYLRIVNKHGDTTAQVTHQRALAELKVRNTFRTTMNKEALMREIDQGFPVAIGVLHHGPVSNPSGGGHYITVRGYTETHALVHDPYGSIDLVNGGWSAQGGTHGKDEQYSWQNLLPRWCPEGPNSGWGWCFS